MRKTLTALMVLLSAVAAVVAQDLESNPLPYSPDLNKQAVKLVMPSFPESAIVDNADGSNLVVRVVVSSGGIPISAKCSLTCHPMLRDAAELAAMTSTFKTIEKDGRPIKYEGLLMYSFVVERVIWSRFGTALESVRQFRNISATPVANMLSSAFADEKASLKSIDENGGVDPQTKQKTLYDVEVSIRSKLKGVDRWTFNTSIALRRISFISALVENVDKQDLAEGLAVLKRYVDSAPAEVSRPLIAELNKVTEYQIPEKIGDRELKAAIFELTKKIRFADQ